MPAHLAVLVLSLCGTAGGVQSTGELIDRTLAIVSGQAITLSDVRAALGLRLLDHGDTEPSVAIATRLLIERALVLREVQRYAPPEPSAAAIDARVLELARRAGATTAWQDRLVSLAFSEVQMRAWARDDLRIAAYLDQRFASAGSPERRAELVRDWISDIRRRTQVVELKP